jgi:taurine--2-oxoglutarate transaminase
MTMTSAEMVELCTKHTLFTWARSGAVNPLPIARASGIYFWTPEGQRFIDWNSQLMCVNIGHGHPKVLEAMKRALDDYPLYTFPGSATEPRARLGERLAGLLPGDLNTFFFTIGGAEANENAIKFARLYTGRHKILARYRSYHGATNLCMQLTGDPRRWANEPGSPGIVHVMDPQPYDYSFGQTEAEQTENNLRYLEEVIGYEGGQNIAAMIIEPVTGTNGILPPPEGYLQGLKALLSKHGILLICDEVMSGFGRTGTWFAFEHGNIVPDIVTMAKGLTSGYVPLGAVAVSDEIASHFQDNVFWGGLTYNSHAFACATALAVIDVLESEDLPGRAASLQPVVERHMAELADKHPCFKASRSIGLFGMIDLQRDAAGTPAAPYNGTSEAMTAMNATLRERGLFTFLRWGHVMCNPPLIITEAQLSEGYEIIDDGLSQVDRFFEG